MIIVCLLLATFCGFAFYPWLEGERLDQFNWRDEDRCSWVCKRGDARGCDK